MSMPTTNVRNQTPPCQSPLMSMSTTSVRNQTPPLSITFHVNVHYQCQKSNPTLLNHFSCQLSSTSVGNQTPSPLNHLLCRLLVSEIRPHPHSITLHVNMHYQCQKSDLIPSKSPFKSTTSVRNQTSFPLNHCSCPLSVSEIRPHPL